MATLIQSQKKIKRGLADIAAPILFSVGIFAVWEILVLAIDIPEYLLPPPSKIFFALITNIQFLLGHMSMTMLEAVTGYAIGNAIGFAIAVIFVTSRSVEKGLYPYAIALKTTPVIAMAPLLILWFGSGFESKVATAALICFFPIIVNSVKGLKAVDDDALDLFRSYFASKTQVFMKLRLPTALPYVFAGLKISTGFAVVGAVVGEFVGANQGIGYLILTSSYRLETTIMFAAIIISALGGVSFFALLSLLEKRLIFWQRAPETT